MFQHSSANSAEGNLICAPKTTCYSRVLTSDGYLNVHIKDIPNKYRRYAKDLGNTLINTRWRWILLTLTLGNGLAWLAFAFGWMCLAMYSGDNGKTDGQPDVCIVGTRHFTGYLLLSIETLTTIGFGEIYPADCLHSWWILALEAMAGVAIEGALVTAVYVKMSRPIKRVNGLLSKKGVVCMRDGRFCLVFRIYDQTGRYWTKSKIKAFMISGKNKRRSSSSPTTCSRSEEVFRMQKLQLEPCELLAGPVDIVHVITSRSPLWTLAASDFLLEGFEIVLTVNGDSATTGQPSEAKKSYTSRDIQWGCRFVPCVEFDENAGSYVVDFNRFNSTRMYATPLCSPAQLRHLISEIDRKDTYGRSSSAGTSFDK